MASCHSRGDARATATPRGPLATPPGALATLPSSDHCIDACAEDGLCAFDGASCVARTDADCASSKSCRYRERCLARDGRCFIAGASDEVCAPPTKGTDAGTPSPCRDQGECVSKDGACRAARSEDCRASEGCSFDGRCDLQGRRCVASEKGCASSTYCQSVGMCVLHDDRCVATEASCRASATCKVNGSCHVIAPLGDAICAPLDDADCRAAEVCKESGKCLRSGDECIARSAPLH